MSRPDQNLSETDIRSFECRRQGNDLEPMRDDSRAWLTIRLPVCPELARHRIRHLAVAHMPSPFEIVRTKLGGSYFLACFGGEGRVLVDGRWTKCRPGHAVLLPPGTLHAFQDDAALEIGIFAGSAIRNVRPTSTGGRRLRCSRDLTRKDLRLAILGSVSRMCPSATARFVPTNACERQADSVAINRWLDLIQHYVLRFAEPARSGSKNLDALGASWGGTGRAWDNQVTGTCVSSVRKTTPTTVRERTGPKPKTAIDLAAYAPCRGTSE